VEKKVVVNGELLVKDCKEGRREGIMVATCTKMGKKSHPSIYGPNEGKER